MRILFAGKRRVFSRFFSCCNIKNVELSQEHKHEIDQFWKDKIVQSNFDPKSNKPKHYVLSMFPYPSGKLHMGHVRVYVISDTMARFYRMNGKNVIHPIGWDAFGLPAENAAIEHNTEPSEWTKQNIEQMRSQLKKLNCSFDWDLELSTCDPSYYKWTQFLFLKLYKAGLVYQKDAIVNWDPVDKTVLADEQVNETGLSWRSNALVQKKRLKQWFIKTTEFAKDMFDGLNDSLLKDWRDVIKIQKHWIGDCSGVNFSFNINCDGKEIDEQITIWLEKPEEILNLDFIVFQPNTNSLKIENFSGKPFVQNPFNNRQIPIFIANLPEELSYYLAFLNDETNPTQQFRKQFNLSKQETFYFRDKQEALQIRNDILSKSRDLKIGGYWTSKHLRDWLISRQRYWGTPIPIIYCGGDCGIVPVPETNLPVVLPPISDRDSWQTCKCPNCGHDAKRETDTMDTFVDSSWYYVRYLDPKNENDLVDKDLAKKFYPVDMYIGGKEHACLHLYYARFMSRFLHKLGMVPEKEPFKRLLVQGMVKGRSYQLEKSGQYLPRNEVEFDSKKRRYFEKSSGETVIGSWEKMSKSKCNGVEPNEMFDKYGVDTTRLIILADVAPMSERNWSNKTFPGIINWQRRLWLIVKNFVTARESRPEMLNEESLKHYNNLMFDSRNYYIKIASFNFESSQQISVAISKLQGLTNDLNKAPKEASCYAFQFERALSALIIMLAPISPCFASELWSHFVSAPNRFSTDCNEIQWDRSVLEQKWPVIDSDYKLDVHCQFGNEEIQRVKIPKYLLDDNSISEIEKYVLENKEIRTLMESEQYLLDYKDLQSYKPQVFIIEK